MMMILALMLGLIGDGLHNDDYLPLNYSGLWMPYADELNAHGGTWRQTSSGTLTFSFVGDGFAVFAPRFDGGGTASVCVNDDDCLMVDYDASVTVYGIEIVSVYGLGAGVHDVIISAETGAIAIEAIYIAPSLPLPTPTPIPDDWINVSDSGYRFEYRADGGQVISVIFQVATLIVIGFFGVLWWFKDDKSL